MRRIEFKKPMKATYKSDGDFTCVVVADHIVRDERCLGKHRVSIKMPYAKQYRYVPIRKVEFL